MAFLLMVLMILAPSAQRPTDIVRWTAATPSKAVAAGGTVKIELTAKIEDGWKLYALSQPKGGPVPLEILLEKGTPFTLLQKQITGPLPKVEKDDNFNLDTQYYEREAAFTVPIMVPKAASGKQQVPLDVTFQACGASICLRPFTQRISVDINVSR
jgi:DsbC/DsbD-like thiol-disulfide interchange protein